MFWPELPKMLLILFEILSSDDTAFIEVLRCGQNWAKKLIFLAHFERFFV